MKTLTIWLVMLAATMAWAQDGPPAEKAPPPVSTEAEPEESADEGVLLRAVELRDKVRSMRRSVLGGGPAVEKAEREALSFYRRKIQETESRIDSMRTERDAKDAEYRLALDSTLESEDGGEAAARHAARLRAEIKKIDGEIVELGRQRDQLSAAVASIQARGERRTRIMAHLEEEETIQNLPFLGEDVLGPDEEDLAEEDPFADDDFLTDLFRRDPHQAKKILFARDPDRYWRLFPLKPPERVLRDAFPYPSARGK